MTAVPTRPAATAPLSNSARRRAVLVTTVVIIAAFAAVALLNILAARFRSRTDATAMGEQTLAPRTQLVLDRLDDTYRVVIAADLKAVDPRAKRHVVDVLDALSRESRRLSYSFVDTGSATGLAAYKDLVKELVAREDQTLRDQTAAVELACGAGMSLSSYLTDTLSPAVVQVQESISPAAKGGQASRTALEQAAAGLRLASRDLADAVGRAQDNLKFRLDDLAVPATDRAGQTMSEALSQAIGAMNLAGRELRKAQQTDGSAGPAADSIRSLLPAMESRRDSAGIVVDSLRRLKRPDILRVTDALRKGSTVLVIGPPKAGIAAIDLDALLPPAMLLDAGLAKADVRRRAEELIATAIASLQTPIRPIVVVMHAESGEFFDSTPFVRQLTERLRLRGVDLIEWAVLVAPQPPQLSALNPDRNRPVIYASLAPDASSPTGQGGLTGAQRAAKLAEVITTLSGNGQNLLLSLNPSVLPTFGDADPLVTPLLRFGVTADTGRPLLQDRVTPRGRLVETDATIQVSSNDSTHPLAGAVRGLPTTFPWAIPLAQRPSDEKVRLTFTPLYAIPASGSVWSESQWLRLWQTPRDQRALLPDLPTFDDGRDSRWPEGKATGSPQQWTVAAAVERNEVGAKPQRIVVVGSNSWFIDPVTQQQVSMDGRAVARSPGNLELFESAVYWLAGQDQLIAQSPTASAVAMIGPIEEKTLGRLRLAVIAGLPLLILMAGATYRFIRR